MNCALLAVALVAACGDKEHRPQREPAPVSQPGSAQTNPSPVPATSHQMITGVIDDWTSTHARLQLWSRDNGGPWRAATPAWDAVIGRGGAAWGVGLNAPGDGPAKHEGDGKAPVGVFALRAAYGYAAAAPDGTKLAYSQADKLECIDDPKSSLYTQIVDGARPDRDWNSSEHMKRADALYTWVIDIAHNAKHIPGSGSCIFFHVWSGPDSTTSGCTAMAQNKLEALLHALDPAANPVYVLLLRKDYEVHQTAWGLPPL